MATNPYIGPKYGDISQGESQFQGRVVENAYNAMAEYNRRNADWMNKDSDSRINPYDMVIGHSENRFNLSTDEVCIKEKREVPTDFNSDDLYAGMRTYDANINPSYPHVTSSFNKYLIKVGVDDNGITKPEFQKLSPEDKRYWIRKNWQLAGIVGTNNDNDGIHGRFERADLPIQLGGIYDIANLGKEFIECGEIIIWDAPAPPTKMGPIRDGTYTEMFPDKITVEIRPLRRAMFFDYNRFVQEIDDIRNELGITARNDFSNIKTEIMTRINFAPPTTAGAAPATTGFFSEIVLPATPLLRALVQSFIKQDGIKKGILDSHHQKMVFKAFCTRIVKDTANKINLNILQDAFVHLLMEPTSHALKEFFDCYHDARMDLQSRVVGRALTSAGPNQRIRTHMGRYSV